MLRRCSKCQRKKIEKLFPPDRTRNGYGRYCRKCQSETQKAYHQTPKGKAAVAWRSLNQRTRNRDGTNPTYAQIEVRMTRCVFVAWMIAALADWAKHASIADATVDRIRSTGHYEIGNLRLATAAEQVLNREASKNYHAPTGLAWCSGFCKSYRPVGKFGRNKNRVNGLAQECKFCHRRRLKQKKPCKI